MNNKSFLTKQITTIDMCRTLRHWFLLACKEEVDKIIQTNVSKLADNFGFNKIDAIRFLYQSQELKSNILDPVTITMSTITNTGSHKNNSFNAGNMVISNIDEVQMSNNTTSYDNTNGPADQEQNDGLNADPLEHNEENTTFNHIVEDVVKDVIKKLCDCNLVDDIEKAKIIGNEVVQSHTFEHSMYITYQALKIEQLKSILREKGLKTSGKKADLIKRIIDGPSEEPGRKACEAPFSELLLAYALCNPNAESYTDHNAFPKCIITDALREQYKEDMNTKTQEVLDKYFEDCKQITHKFLDHLNITTTDDIEVFVQGKCITHPKILELTKSIKERTQKKADLYILVNGTRWIGISVKTTPFDTKSNWSIERLIGEQDLKLKETIKNSREEINKQNGIGRDWRKYKSETHNKEYNRKIYNESMYGNNAYKTHINTWIMNDENKAYLQTIIAKAAGSSNEFEMYECNGHEYRDLRGIYCKIKNASEFRLLQDTPETKNNIEETLNRKSHYSNTAAKLWYYVLLNDTPEYRIEIRWKGDPFASPQLLLYDL